MSLALGSGISCPDGGSFYVCQGNTTQFLGCCISDPCADGKGSCTDDDIRNTTFSSSVYDSILPQDCVDTGQWYTCAYTSPPFMGCCLTSPCSLGSCYGDNVTAARLSDNATYAAVFETATASTSALSSTSTSTPNSSTTMHMTSLSTGAIIGIAIGSALAALVIGVVLFCCYKRKERKNSQRLAQQGQPGPMGTPGIHVPSPYQDSSPFPSPPFQRDGIMRDKMSSSIPSSPSQASHGRSSWLSIFSSKVSGHRRVPSDDPSVSSGGVNQGDHNQQPQYPQQNLNIWPEADSTEIHRPRFELSGSAPMTAAVFERPANAHGTGYGNVALADGRGEQ